MVQVQNLTKSFGKEPDKALDGLSFRVDAGEVVAVLGPNGAGKTTVINVLATLLIPDSGSASVNGHDVVTEPERVRESISLTGQFAAVDPELTGLENLVFFGRLLGLGRKGSAQRARELLDDFQSTSAADTSVKKYSGGMRRRLDIAASLIVPPLVLFLDEPTTGLDPRSRLELWHTVRRLRDSGMAVVLTTQYLDEADHLADRVVVVDHGRVIAEGTPAQLKSRTGPPVCELKLADPDGIEVLMTALQDLSPVRLGDEAVAVPATDGPATLSAAMQRAADAGVQLGEVTMRGPSLDEVFFALTGSGRK